MGEKLLRYYKYITEQAGLQGKIRLSKRTKIPSMRAALEPDSEKNIRTFKTAVEEITQKKAPDF